MKLSLYFLMCFFSVAWQQNVQWALPTWRSPYYNQLPVRAYGPIFASQAKRLPYPNLIAHHDEPNIRTRTNANQRAFGLSGINYLASLILSSLSLTATSTTFTTSTSTINGVSVVTCLTSTMFSATTACRRKRAAVSDMLIGDYDHNKPYGEENVFGVLPREGRDVNPTDILASSWNEQDLDVFGTVTKQTEKSINRYVRKLTSTVTSTSVLTSYSVSVQTSTSTVTNLASSAALSCLPSGFTLC
ncbi:uncharacterized protein LOC130700752 [Daphnia carinata]|uniref:uncharacterized protein LOC130700752 n=1 Tax=Daphnia carinata TaxID=120202 RepID=UPI00257A84B5|nr:uncharacterized protein LOC130700752 [Daphnia carinata]